LFDELCIEPVAALEKQVATYTEGSLGASAKILQQLEEKEKELVAEKRKRDALIKDLAHKISLLWERLKIPIPERDAFLRRQAGPSNIIIEAVSRTHYIVPRHYINNFFCLVQGRVVSSGSSEKD